MNLRKWVQESDRIKTDTRTQTKTHTQTHITGCVQWTSQTFDPYTQILVSEKTDCAFIFRVCGYMHVYQVSNRLRELCLGIVFQSINKLTHSNPFCLNKRPFISCYEYWLNCISIKNRLLLNTKTKNRNRNLNSSWRGRTTASLIKNMANNESA